MIIYAASKVAELPQATPLLCVFVTTQQQWSGPSCTTLGFLLHAQPMGKMMLKQQVNEYQWGFDFMTIQRAMQKAEQDGCHYFVLADQIMDAPQAIWQQGFFGQKRITTYVSKPGSKEVELEVTYARTALPFAPTNRLRSIIHQRPQDKLIWQSDHDVPFDS